tara:strand:- start:179 stop:289 length:111 start_codon:yes stop_codon:yes gene_type:complete
MGIEEVTCLLAFVVTTGVIVIELINRKIKNDRDIKN